jgi:site-specific DNA-cytosine methylase
MRKLRVLDLFSGIGGFSLGLERTGGFETVAFCEIEPYPRAVLAKHWPSVPCYDDVCTLTADTLRRNGIAVDVICGGFPCTDLSAAGQQAGLCGTRSGLVWEYLRLVAELTPCAAIIENVANFRRGSDVAEEHAIHCLCGWACRWRGMPDGDGADQQRMYKQELFGSVVGGNGGQGQAAVEDGACKAWRNPADQGFEQPETSGPRCVEHAHKECATSSKGAVSAHDREAGTMPSRDCGLQVVGRQAVGVWKNGGCDQGIDLGAKQNRTDHADSWWMVCPHCGRGLDHATRQPLRASWFGTVQRALAAIGYDAEWCSISAAAVGAPHMRERVWVVAYPRRQRLQGLHEARAGKYLQSIAGAIRRQWPTEPEMARVADGIPRGVVRDPIKAFGNCVVPQIPELIGRAILEAEGLAA